MSTNIKQETVSINDDQVQVRNGQENLRVYDKLANDKLDEIKNLLTDIVQILNDALGDS